MSNYWTGKTCLITGASAGLGLAISRALAERDARVVMMARHEPRLFEAAEQIRVDDNNILPAVGDVTSTEDVERIRQEIHSQWGPLDLLCNCAGRSTRGEILETQPAEFQQLWEINFLSAVRFTNAFAADLIQNRGHLVNIGSLAGKLAPKYLGAYPASKFALSAYTQQLRLELGPQGLHALLVCPGPIQRADSSPRYADQSESLPDEAQRPGAGAKLRGIKPQWLAERILLACQRREPELVVPGKVRLLCALGQLSPRLGDWLLRKATSG